AEWGAAHQGIFAFGRDCGRARPRRQFDPLLSEHCKGLRGGGPERSRVVHEIGNPGDMEWRSLRTVPEAGGGLQRRGSASAFPPAGFRGAGALAPTRMGLHREIRRLRKMGGATVASYYANQFGNVLIRSLNLVAPARCECPCCGWRGARLLNHVGY